MKIKAKILSIVAVMGMVAMMLGVVSIFVAERYSQKLDEYQNSSEKAYMGARLNQLVTAVAMETRGIYLSADTAEATEYANGLVARLNDMDALFAKWRPLVSQNGIADFEALTARAAEFRKLREDIVRVGTQESPAKAQEEGYNDANKANRKAFQAATDAVVNADLAKLDAVVLEIATFRTTIRMAVLLISVIGIGIGTLLAIKTGARQLATPILNLTGTMKDMAAGNYDQKVPFTENPDEIGDMARAVEVFRENGLKVHALNMASEAERQRVANLQSAVAEVTQRAAAGDFSQRIQGEFGHVELNRFAQSINLLMANVETGLNETGRVIESLASGDLTQTMTGRFEGAFANLQRNVNQTMETLQKMIGEVRNGTGNINAGSQELRDAADDLSRRTEQQAAALEETSAALDEITAVVRNSTERAQEANVMVGQAKADANRSAEVVRNAIDAMGRIEQASNEISQIINVIDEIAFQTNLLALNAGVEAARAGDAGKGFAVVAQEVRELAQRSANAAKDIKELITKSGSEVEGGVKLVQQTGIALAKIEDQVSAINDHIHSIATAAREQSTGISEVNNAVNQMDQVTQKNAAMVEETSAATHKLASEANYLSDLVARFRLSQNERPNLTRAA